MFVLSISLWKMGFNVRAELQLNKMRILLPSCSPKGGVDQPEAGCVQGLLLGWLCPQLSLGAAGGDGGGVRSAWWG